MALSQPKQFVEIAGRSLLDWSLSAVLADTRVRRCMVALPRGAAQQIDSQGVGDARLGYCQGGETRAESVAAGIAALEAEDDDWVLVHDAARPCLSAADLKRLIDEVTTKGIGGLLALPLTDTLKRGDARNGVLNTIDRAGLWRAQTPQMFRVAELRAALLAARDARLTVTDEASAMELAGHEVLLVEGSSVNLKVTFPEDLKVADLWLAERGTHGE